MMRRTWLLFPLAAALAGCSGAPVATGPGAQRACFWASQVTGFSAAGPDTALVSIGARETWELTLSPGCPDVDWAMRIGIRARGGERICPGRPAELVVPDASGRGSRSCLVREVRRLSPEEARTARGEAPQRD